MALIVPSDGPVPNRLLLIGERPGADEHAQYTDFLNGYDVDERFNFIGPAGQELWARMWRIGRMERSAFHVGNLVPTLGFEAPTPEEIAEHLPRLRLLIARVQPEIIVTVGYHAARALLPQFADLSGDYFHGLAFPYTYGKLTPRHATVVPIIHSSAALRQPDRYQAQLTDDIRVVRAVVKADDPTTLHHRSRTIVPTPVTLAGFSHPKALGVDTEGSVQAPEAITLSHERTAAHLAEPHLGPISPFVGAAMRAADAIYIHNIKHDWQVLATCGVLLDELPIERLHCTMELAYLLQEPQGLKALSFRRHGFVMSDYQDLVRPYDDEQVRNTLIAWRIVFETTIRQHKAYATELERACRARATAAKRARRGREKAGALRDESAEAGGARRSG